MSDAAALLIQVVGTDGKILRTIQLDQNIVPPREWETKKIESADAAVLEYVDAVRAGCAEHMHFADKALSEFSAWADAYDRLCKLDLDPDADLKEAFLEHWRHRGATIRRWVGDDELLLSALRRLLSGYTGGDLILFRGETDANIASKAYGPSWTSKLQKAAEFARSEWQDPSPRSVVATVANPEAILAAPNEESKRQGEFEYVVDRQRLTGAVFTLAGCAWSGAEAINKAAVALEHTLAATKSDQVEWLQMTLLEWAAKNGYFRK